MRNAGYFNALICATCLKLLCHQGALQHVVPFIHVGCGTSEGDVTQSYIFDASFADEAQCSVLG